MHGWRARARKVSYVGIFRSERLDRAAV